MISTQVLHSADVRPNRPARRGPIAAALAAVLVVVSCGGPDVGVSSDEVILGTFAPMSGPHTALGDVAVAMSAYFDWVNDQGGVHGRNIRLIVKDDQADPEQTPALVTELLRVDQAFALIGGMGSDSALAVKDDVWNRLTPWVNPGSSSPVWTEPINAYTFSMFPSSVTAGRVVARHALADLGARRIGSIVEATQFGSVGQEGYRLGVRAFYQDLRNTLPEGMEVRYARVNGRPRRPRTSDPASEGWLEEPASGPGVLWQVQRSEGGSWGRPENAPENVGSQRVAIDGSGLEDALMFFKDQRADAVVVWGIAEFSAMVVRAIAADDDWDPLVLGGLAMADPNAVALAEGALEGAVVASATPDLQASGESLRTAREIIAQYAPELVFGDYALLGLAWAQLAHEGMERAGPDLTRIGLLRALETLDEWNGFIGHPISFSEENHRGMDAVTLKRVEGGEFVALTGWLSE